MIFHSLSDYRCGYRFHITNNRAAAAWEIFACLCNGGTLVIRGSKWEPAIELVSVRGRERESGIMDRNELLHLAVKVG